MTANSNQNAHFNLHLSGVGYLNRVRWVKTSSCGGRKAEPFLACSISAMHGSSDEPSYTYLDLRVSGREAIEMVDQLGADVDAKRKVFVSFRVGDIYPHLYERSVRDQSGKPTGEKETAAIIKGRLLLLNSITIDGERVYTRESEQEPASGAAPQPVQTSQEPEPAQAM